MTANPGRDVPIPKCGKRCGRLMDAFDQLPRPLRDFHNDEATIQWCMCQCAERYRALGTAETLQHYRELERQYR
jgi:Family of unknown function (DUF6525)